MRVQKLQEKLWKWLKGTKVGKVTLSFLLSENVCIFRFLLPMIISFPRLSQYLFQCFTDERQEEELVIHWQEKLFCEVGRFVTVIILRNSAP